MTSPDLLDINSYVDYLKMWAARTGVPDLLMKALIYSGLNMPEEALIQFEKSSQARDYILPVMLGLNMSYLDVPGIENFVASPRYQALLAKIKYN